MRRVGIIGANGQLGRYLCEAFAGDPGVAVCRFDHAELEVADKEGITRALTRQPVDVLINTSAAHGPAAETDLPHTFAVNALGPAYLAEYCAGHGVDLLHVSTDYVFSGHAKRPYREADRPEPVNGYGVSKLAGELLIRANMANYYVVRVSALFGVGGCRAKHNSNFVEMMLSKAREGKPISVVDDQRVSPTYALDAAEGIKALVQTRRYGTYHMSNTGSCTWYEYAKEIFALSGVSVDLQPIATAAAEVGARRPMHSVLDNERLRSVGLPDLRSWREALDAYLQERAGLRGLPDGR